MAFQKIDAKGNFVYKKAYESSYDSYDNYKSINVGFRVSPLENKMLNEAVSLSGLSKQEFIAKSLFEKEPTFVVDLRNVSILAKFEQILEQINDNLNSLNYLKEDLNDDEQTMILKKLNKIILMLDKPNLKLFEEDLVEELKFVLKLLKTALNETKNETN